MPGPLDPFLEYVYKIVLSVSPKIEESWPHIKKLGEELDHLVTILNGGHPVVHATGGTLTEPVKRIKDALTLKGVPEQDAEEFAMKAACAADRLAQSS